MDGLPAGGCKKISSQKYFLALRREIQDDFVAVIKFYFEHEIFFVIDTDDRSSVFSSSALAINGVMTENLPHGRKGKRRVLAV